MRLIDADALESKIIKEKDAVVSRDTYGIGYNNGMSMAHAMSVMSPTIDAVEVVRCGLCRYCDTKDCPMSGTPGSVSVSDFCSYGERKDNE